jgi:transcriptional regulator with XRE-family HTH domain
MRNNTNNPNDREAAFRAMREMILEATPSELFVAIREAGLDPKEISEIGRNAINSALTKVRQDSEKASNSASLHKGLNSLLVMLRRRDNLDEAELAAKANVDEDEVRRIEYDSSYLPSPRTIFKLEKAFSLPAGVLAKLSGAIKAHSLCMEERVQAFAANAKAMGKLTREERELLNAFVKFLSEHE